MPIHYYIKYLPITSDLDENSGRVEQRSPLNEDDVLAETLKLKRA